MAKAYNIANNKLKNAVRSAGWDSISEFCKDFNIPVSTFHNWTSGIVSSIFYSKTNTHLIFELCKIFDCSKDELNNMVRNAYRVKHGHPEEEPEKVPLGNKDATFARYLAYDEKKKEENSNGEIPLEDFIKNENPDFFEEYPEIKAEVEDDRDPLFKKAQRIQDNAIFGIGDESETKPIKKPQRAYYTVKKPIVLGKKGMDRQDLVDHILDEAYGKIPYRDFISLGNVLRDWARFNE